MTTQGVKRKLTAILSGLVVKAGKKQIAYSIVNKAAMEAFGLS